MPYTVSAEAREMIEHYEGLRLDAYQCPAGVWTIGFGHTTGVQPGDHITPEMADGYFASDINIFASAVEAALGGAPTSQHEFDALVSLAFNIGIEGFKKSTVLRLHKAGDKAGAARAFGMWNKATVNGVLQEMEGLTRRRAEEAAYYLTPDRVISASPPMPQAVAPPPSLVSSKTVLAGVTGIVTGAGAIVDNAGAVKDVIDNVTAATTSMGAMKSSLGAIFSGSGLSAVFGVVSLVCIVTVVVRYILKARNGEVAR